MFILGSKYIVYSLSVELWKLEFSQSFNKWWSGRGFKENAFNLQFGYGRVNLK